MARFGVAERSAKNNRDTIGISTDGSGCAVCLSGLLRQLAHYADEIAFTFETDAGQLGHENVAVFDAHAVGKSAVGLEEIRVAFITAEAKPGGEIERHLVAERTLSLYREVLESGREYKFETEVIPALQLDFGLREIPLFRTTRLRSFLHLTQWNILP